MFWGSCANNGLSVMMSEGEFKGSLLEYADISCVLSTFKFFSVAQGFVPVNNANKRQTTILFVNYVSYHLCFTV